jgi:hypothetical protein
VGGGPRRAHGDVRGPPGRPAAASPPRRRACRPGARRRLCGPGVVRPSCRCWAWRCSETPAAGCALPPQVWSNGAREQTGAETPQRSPIRGGIRGARQQAPRQPAWPGPASRSVARAACGGGGSCGGRPVGVERGAPGSPSPQHARSQVAPVCAGPRTPQATWATLWPSTTARLARPDGPWRLWPRRGAVFLRHSTALR